MIVVLIWICLLLFIEKDDEMGSQLFEIQHLAILNTYYNNDLTSSLQFNNQWQSNITIDFDDIISSIKKSNDIHISLKDCSICERVEDNNNSKYQYKVKNKSTLNFNIKEIDYIEDLEPFLITCSNELDKSFDLELPIGYPLFNQSTMGQWIHNFQHFCFTHSSGIELDNTFINEKYLFRMGFTFKDYGIPWYLKDKYLIDLTPQNTPQFIGKSPFKIRNMVFLSTYFGGNAFQLFLSGVSVKMSMIHILLLNQLEKYENEYLNVTIVSHLDIRPKSEIEKNPNIQSWFWLKFMKYYHENEQYKDRIRINLLDAIDHIGWVFATNYSYYSEMWIMPHLILQKPHIHKYDHYLYPRGILNPLSWMFECEETKDIKPYIILYYGRGDHITLQRSIKNNRQVISAIKSWIDNVLNKLQHDVVYEFKKLDPVSIQHDQELVSKAILHIGPHGGKLANLVWAKRDTFVLEFNDWLMKHIRPGGEMRSTYYALSQAKNLHYYYYCPKNFDYKKNTTHPRKSLHMEVNIEHLNKVLHMIQERILENHNGNLD